MKKILILILSLMLGIAFFSNAQDSRLLKAADKAFDDGEKEYSKKHYSEAAASLEIVVENIPITTDSRKYLIMRFEAHIMLVDIYFNQLNNLPSACRAINSFLDDLDTIKQSGIFKAKEIYNYLDLEKQYTDNKRKCDNYESINDSKKDFEKIFDEEFEEDEE